MDLHISDKENEKIEKIAFHYYYNASKWSREQNTMSVHLCDRITNEAPLNTAMERGIITAFSFFLDQEFLISNDDQFPNQLQPGVPANWRNKIRAFDGDSTAKYFMRKRNQTYVLSVMYDSFVRKVTVKVTHTTVNHKPKTVEFREADLLALSDPDHRIAFALHLVNMCSSEYTDLVDKAVQDKPPTAQRTPLH